jgi:heat-inducible transcriptional repressor
MAGMNEHLDKKSSKKQRREYEVLRGVITLYLKLGKHIGSNTLRENGFEHLSPATIRNYFAELEKEGLLEQAHASGGRIPTQKAFRLYAQEHLDVKFTQNYAEFGILKELESRGISKYISQAADILSEITHYPTFVSSCRFDHDLITDIKLVQLGDNRLLFVILTEFGQVFTETYGTTKKYSLFSLRRFEGYFRWKLRGENKPLTLSSEEERYALSLYNEIIVRYLVRYSNFTDEDLYRTGFSKLLSYPELNDPVALTSALSLFENSSHMRLLLADAAKKGGISYLIGQDLAPYAAGGNNCSVITINYCIGQTTVGAFGILGPIRMDYPELFIILRQLSEVVSKALTGGLYKYKLSYRLPRSGSTYLETENEWKALDQRSNRLLEIKEKQ